MNYLEVIAKLSEAETLRGMQFGLENIHKAALALNFPEKTFPSVHVAGTNGKGSVTTKIGKALEYAGYKVGLYTSPHLFCFRERIAINSKPVSEGVVVEEMEKIFPIGSALTFFELTTLLAFQIFSKEQVDIAIIETGLGGRLDATNILTPLLSVITSISLDHTALLGSTLEEIAAEKAGIIKPTIPCVIGPKARFEAIFRRAEQLGSPIYQAPSFKGFYDNENQEIAHLALKLLTPAFAYDARGLLHRPPCRFEEVDGVIFDVAHNPDGFSRLVEALHHHYPYKKFRFIVGMSKDKEIKQSLSLILPVAAHIYLVTAGTERSASPHLLANTLEVLNYHTFSIESSIPEVLAKAKAGTEQTVVCGSFFILSLFQRVL